MLIIKVVSFFSLNTSNFVAFLTVTVMQYNLIGSLENGLIAKNDIMI